MGQRRMLSLRIANSAKFLQMPTDTQLLYFHMVIRADDDGVVECYPLIKMLGFSSDNFKILLAKEYIKQLNDEQVIIILDWLEHNVIRADRKVNSIYHNLIPKDIKTVEPKARIDVKNNSLRLNGQSTDGLREVKLSKDNKSIANKSKDLSLPDWLDNSLWNDFLSMRKIIKKPMSERAVILMVKKLEQFKQKGLDYEQALEQSILNNWSDVYEPKNQCNTSQNWKKDML